MVQTANKRWQSPTEEFLLQLYCCCLRILCPNKDFFLLRITWFQMLFVFPQMLDETKKPYKWWPSAVTKTQAKEQSSQCLFLLFLGIQQQNNTRSSLQIKEWSQSFPLSYRTSIFRIIPAVYKTTFRNDLFSSLFVCLPM